MDSPYIVVDFHWNYKYYFTLSPRFHIPAQFG